MWMAALVVGAMVGRADAADIATEASVRRLVVSIPDRKLAVVEDNHVVEVYAVAVGAPNSPSPTGTFTIVNRVANPTYYHPGKVIAPGPENPIGTRWIGLNQKGYGIHGTDQPSSIGYAKSHGCIRLRNADVERLFERVRPGDVVELHAERTPELDELFTSPY
jgi:lipoprotein-anchoring transpeptidase ErfK/SrfK